MFPIHAILHGTDFSDHSGYGLGLACALARDYQARLVVLHVAAPLAVVFEGGVIVPYPEEYRQELRQRLQGVQVPDPAVPVTRLLAEGDPVAAIVRTARAEGCDLIVLGTHGRRGLGRLLLGSVAEGVLRSAPCPVLTVKMPFPAPAEKAEEVAGYPMELAEV
jgi:nucleotide-binding universal stress UspA family protein